MRLRLAPRRTLVAAVTAGALVWTATAASAATFRDVGDSVHAEAIEALAADGVLTGKTADTFDPGGTLTRAQFASIIARAADLDPDGSRPFADVTGGPHADAIAAATAEGLIQGYPDGTFRPSAAITRDQMAALLARWIEPDPVTSSTFSDLGDSVHADAIEALAAADVVRGTGDGTTFSPRAEVRRDQAASFVFRALGGNGEDGGGGEDGDGWCYRYVHVGGPTPVLMLVRC